MDETNNIDICNQDSIDFELLPVRAKNVLKDKKIYDIESLLKYYKTNGINFRKLDNCGVKTERCIIELCEKSLLKRSDTVESNNTDLLEILMNKVNENREQYGTKIVKYFIGNVLKDEHIDDLDLTVRAINCCYSNRIKRVSDLLKYYNEKGNFLKWRNLGKKTNSEIVKLCKKYKNLFNEGALDKFEGMKEMLDYKMYENKNTIINSHILNYFRFETDEFHFETITKLLSLGCNFCDLYNLFINRAQEICLELDMKIAIFKGIIRHLEDTLELILNSSYDEISSENFTLLDFEALLKKVLKEDNYGIIKQTYVRSKENEIKLKDFKIFNFFNYYSNKFCVFGADLEREYYIYTIKNNFFLGDKKTMNQIGIEYGLSRERVRQISENPKWNLKLHVFWSSLTDLLEFTKYSRIKNAKVISVNEKFVEYFNSNESVLYTNEFYFSALKSMLKLTHNSYSIYIERKGTIACQFFINKTIDTNFDFSSFMYSILDDYYKDNNKTYRISLQKYISRYYYSVDKINENELLPVCETLIHSFLDLEITNSSIIFKRNTKYKIYEYPYEILAESNTPLTLDEIYFKCKIIFPNASFTKESLRAAMNKIDLFICFGRTSTYGLKEWEKYRDIKGGTIRKMVEELLASSERPLHLQEISEYVKKYRDTDSSSIQGNLRLETKSNIDFLPMGFYALKDKAYGIDISYKKFPPHIFNYIRKLLQNVANSYSYENLISHFASKYSLNKDMVKLVIDKEIKYGFLSIDKYQRVSLNDYINNITDLKFAKYFNVKDKNDKELESIFKDLVLAIELILIESDFSLYSIKKKIDMLNVFELDKIELSDLLEDHPNFSNEDGVWSLKYCNSDTEAYYNITKEHKFIISDILLNFLNTNLKNVDEVKRYVKLDARFKDSYKKDIVSSKKHDVLDDIIKEFNC